VGVVINDLKVVGQAAEAIRTDVQPENSWNDTESIDQQQAGFAKRLKVNLWSLLPLNPIP
jgi:hypothetical protein